MYLQHFKCEKAKYTQGSPFFFKLSTALINNMKTLLLIKLRLCFRGETTQRLEAAKNVTDRAIL